MSHPGDVVNPKGYAGAGLVPMGGYTWYFSS